MRLSRGNCNDTMRGWCLDLSEVSVAAMSLELAPYCNAIFKLLAPNTPTLALRRGGYAL